MAERKIENFILFPWRSLQHERLSCGALVLAKTSTGEQLVGLCPGANMSLVDRARARIQARLQAGTMTS